MSIQGLQGPIPFPSAAAKMAYARGVGAIAPPTPDRAVESSTEQVGKIVAGQVASPINQGRGFDEILGEATQAGAATPPASIPLYTRSADRIEAATAIAVGRSLDVKG